MTLLSLSLYKTIQYLPQEIQANMLLHFLNARYIAMAKMPEIVVHYLKFFWVTDRYCNVYLLYAALMTLLWRF